MEKRDYKNIVTNGLKEEDGKLVFTFTIPETKKEKKPIKKNNKKKAK